MVVNEGVAVLGVVDTSVGVLGVMWVRVVVKTSAAATNRPNGTRRAEALGASGAGGHHTSANRGQTRARRTG